MQTFLPYKDFTKSAQALDNKRLNKQILECYQILKVMHNDDPHAGWRNHPAVKMWRGHAKSLWNYTMCMVDEAVVRGIKTENNLRNLLELRDNVSHLWTSDEPAWYNNDIVMAKVLTTHKANLYRKDPIYYFDFAEAVVSKSNEPCCERCNYYWVTHLPEAYSKAA